MQGQRLPLARPPMAITNYSELVSTPTGDEQFGMFKLTNEVGLVKKTSKDQRQIGLTSSAGEYNFKRVSTPDITT